MMYLSTVLLGFGAVGIGFGFARGLRGAPWWQIALPVVAGFALIATAYVLRN